MMTNNVINKLILFCSSTRSVFVLLSINLIIFTLNIYFDLFVPSLLLVLIDLIVIIFCKKRIIIFVCFTCFYSTITKLQSVVPISSAIHFIALELIVIYLFQIIKHKTFSFAMLGIFCLIIYSFIINIINNVIVGSTFINSISESIKAILYFLLLFFYYFSEDKKETSHLKTFRFYLVFNFVCVLVALFCCAKDGRARILFDNAVTGGRMYSSGLLFISYRFSGFCWDPNHFSMAIILIDIMFFSFYKEKRNILLISILIIMNIFGLLSGSKMFILSFVLFSILVFTSFILRNKKHMVMYLILSSVVLISFLIILSPYIANFIYNRIVGISNTKTNILSAITTYRSAIFSNYSSYITSNPFVFLFGIRTGGTTIITAEHNTFVSFIYNYGFFVGIALLTLQFYCFFKNIVLENERGYEKILLSITLFIPMLSIVLMCSSSSNGLMPACIIASMVYTRNRRSISI